MAAVKVDPRDSLWSYCRLYASLLARSKTGCRLPGERQQDITQSLIDSLCAPQHLRAGLTDHIRTLVIPEHVELSIPIIEHQRSAVDSAGRIAA
jgi:hypothetical protein